MVSRSISPPPSTPSPVCVTPHPAYARPAALGELEISVTPRQLPDRDEAARFAALGVHRLILMPLAGSDESALINYVSTARDSLIESN